MYVCMCVNYWSFTLFACNLSYSLTRLLVRCQLLPHLLDRKLKLLIEYCSMSSCNGVSILAITTATITKKKLKKARRPNEWSIQIWSESRRKRADIKQCKYVQTHIQHTTQETHNSQQQQQKNDSNSHHINDRNKTIADCDCRCRAILSC